MLYGAGSGESKGVRPPPGKRQKSRPHPKRIRSRFMAPEAGSRKGFAPRPARGKKQDRIQRGYGLALWRRKRGVERGSPPARQEAKSKTASKEDTALLYGAGSGGRTRTLSPGPDFELFASYGIQTNSNPYGGRQRTPKSPQLLIILKLMC